MRTTGIGSWPGTDVREAQARVRDLCPDLPYLVEQPERGPGAQMLGRTAALLVDLPVDLQREGWRLVDRPGRDLRQAQALWRESLDALAEFFDGYVGELKIQVTGPMTMVAETWYRGERVLADAGARRAVAGSLAEAVREHTAHVARLVPGAQVLVQVDEPCLPGVLAGAYRTVSGFAQISAVPEDEVRTAVAEVLAAAGESTVLHCCAPGVPVGLLRRAGVQRLAVDISLLDARAWESVAEAVEGGTELWLGLPVRGGRGHGAGQGGSTRSVSGLAQTVTQPWRELGLPMARLAEQVVTPACGLAGQPGLEAAVRAHRECREVSEEIEEVSRG